jgi:hypothetical protein
MQKNLIWTCAAGAATAAVLAAAVLAAAASLPAAAGASTTTTTLPAKHIGTHTPATTTPTLPAVQAEAKSAVTNRVATLNKAIAHIETEKNLGGRREPLRAYMRADIQRLQQQEHVVSADTDVTQAQRDFVDIFSGFRVYHLVLPAVSLAVRADQVTHTDLPALRAAAKKAASAAQGQSNATVESLVADLNQQIAATTTATHGLASTLLAYTPAQWNANNGLLSPASSSVSTAESAIRKGRADVLHIRQDLHSAVAGGRAKAPHHHG